MAKVRTLISRFVEKIKGIFRKEWWTQAVHLGSLTKEDLLVYLDLINSSR